MWIRARARLTNLVSLVMSWLFAHYKSECGRTSFYDLVCRVFSGDNFDGIDICPYLFLQSTSFVPTLREWRTTMPSLDQSCDVCSVRFAWEWDEMMIRFLWSILPAIRDVRLLDPILLRYSETVVHYRSRGKPTTRSIILVRVRRMATRR